ncbi:hypothetical protein BJV77DRAFT_256093 [Russula vinacea]|nr:hypothetical protein BJV77DRAFT_256093 [Russula vinacea]
MAEDRPVSTVTSAINSEYTTPPPSMPSLPGLDSAPLEPPRASFFSPGPSIGENSPRDSRVESATGQETDKEGFTPGHSSTVLPLGKPEDSEAPLSQLAPRGRPFYRRPAGLAIALGALVAVILAIALPVSLIHKGKHSQSNSSNPGNGNGPGSGNGNPSSPKNSSNAITGGDGSTIVSGNTTFVYKNPFGGYWAPLQALEGRSWGGAKGSVLRFPINFILYFTSR